MKKIYEYFTRDDEFITDERIYYTSEPLEVGKLERQWINNLKIEIAQQSTFEHNIICNLTWFKSNFEQTVNLRNFVESLGDISSVKLWYIGSVDGNYWLTYSYIDIFNYFLQKGYTHSFVGYSDEHWHSWYPEWFIGNNKNVDMNDLFLNQEPKHLYLSYNRKPRIHRTWLVNSIIENNLLDRGWVTFERGHYPEIDKLTAETDQDKHTQDVRFTRPEDITSLGDLEIWRNSYLILVSETDENDPWQLSEKTWKPIFGLRPFLLNAHKDLYKILEKLDFYTPKDFFKNSDLDASYTSLVDQLKKLYNYSSTELYKMWIDQYEMLLYNRRRMFEISISDPTKILNWPQAKSKY